jgi:methionyl-tRNA formyltransferase
VERAILAGDTATGVCIMRMETGLDTGPVLARQFLAMGDEHAAALTERLSHLGADMLVALLQGGTATALAEGEPQRGEPTYASKLSPEDLRLDWQRPAVELQRVVRLDRAWTTFRGHRLRVLEATPLPDVSVDAPPGTLRGELVATGSGALELSVVQPEGRRPMPATEWRRGVREGSEQRLGLDDTDR